MSNLYEIIEKLCKQQNVSITEMCKSSGASRASLTDLKKGRKQRLSTDTLSKIAEYFDVSVDYLLGKTDVKKATSGDNSNYTLNEQQQIQKYHLLNADGKEKVDMYINDLLDNPKYQADAEESKAAMVKIKIAARPKHGTEQPESIFIEKDLDILDFVQEDPDLLDK